MPRPIVTVSLHDYEQRLHSEIAPQLTAAARDIGFFYLTGHGIPQEDIDAAFSVGRKILDQPDAIKGKYPFNPDTYLGWRGLDDIQSVTGTRLWEWFSIGRWGLGGYDWRAQELKGEYWPLELGQEFKDGSLSWQRHAHELSIKVLRALWIGLGRDEKEIYEAFEFDSGESASFLAWNHYPGLTEEEAAKVERGEKLPPRLHAHADGDVLTILFQKEGEPGLEVAPGREVETDIANELSNIWDKVPVAKEWTPVDPKPGCFTVNIGDVLMRWTDGELKSTYHRVRAPKKGDPTGPRYSMPYFFIQKLSALVQGPKKLYAPVTGFQVLSEVGRAYAGQRNSKDKSWQQAAYTEEIAGPAADPPTAAASNSASAPAGASAGHNSNGKALSNGNGSGKGKKEVAVRAQPRAQAALPARAPTAPRAAVPAGLRRSALMGAPLRTARAGL